MAKVVQKSVSKPDRRQETRMIREFVDQLIKDGKAKQFLVEHGFVKQNGGLTKRYGG